MRKQIKQLIEKLKIFFLPLTENNYQPKFLCCNLLAYLAIFVIVIKLAVIPILFYLPKTSFFADISKFTLIELTNKERTEKGLPVLKENQKLNKAATLKAQDILANDYFSHYSPQGKSPWYWFGQVGYKYSIAGENLGIGFLESEEAYRAWDNSPSHRANLLNPKYGEIGIAVVRGDFKGNETVVIVQLFGNSGSLEKLRTETETETETETSSISVLNESVGENREKITAGAATSIISSYNKPEEKAVFVIAKFLAISYADFVQNFIICLFILMIIYLATNIILSIKANTNGSMLKLSSFALLLLIFILANKEFLIKLIPHSPEI